MSFFLTPDPAAGDKFACDAIAQVIVPRTGDLGGFQVRRALPSKQRRMVGPFIFLDEMGPVEFRSGQGLDVRPHPHIGLATVTYLFAGEIMHRDSLGSVAAIRPGEVNWMTAGHGIKPPANFVTECFSIRAQPCALWRFAIRAPFTALCRFPQASVSSRWSSTPRDRGVTR